MPARQPPLTPSQKRQKRRGTIIAFGAAAIFVAVIFAMKPLIGRPARTDDLLALLAAFMLLQMGVVMTLMRIFASKDAAMPGAFYAQIGSILVGAAALLLPMYGGYFIDPAVNFAIILALTAASLAISWQVWRKADELMRSLMRDGYVASYFVLITALTIYAAGERLGLLSAVTAWSALAIATLISFACSIWVTIQRGMDRPPADE